jgi:hypothetical protein
MVVKGFTTWRASVIPAMLETVRAATKPLRPAAPRLAASYRAPYKHGHSAFAPSMLLFQHPKA